MIKFSERQSFSIQKVTRAKVANNSQEQANRPRQESKSFVSNKI